MIELKKDNTKEIKRGDVFWYIFNSGILLPALVIQNNIGNKYSDNTIIIKMNSSEKVIQKSSKIPTIVKIMKHEIACTPKKAETLKDEGYVLTSDIYTIPKDTLRNYIGSLLPTSFYKIEKAIKISLDIV